MPKISIIVPIYNVERFLDQCVKSLLNQTVKDIEIILVDDGSPDNCPAMCDAYQEQYPNIIKVVHQKNGGQNVAWNTGLGVAAGEWVCFIDSDDWVELDMVKIMLRYAENDDAEIHVFGHYKEFVDGQVQRKLEEYVLTDSERLNFTYKDDSIPTEAWGRIFKRSFLVENNLSFYPGHFHHEDVIFNLKAFHFSSKARLHPEMLYHYRMVSSGFIKRWDPTRIEKYSLYLKRYSDFIESCFDEKTSALMVQKHILDIFIYWYSEFYSDPRSGFSKKKRVTSLKKHFNEEPFKSAIKRYPLGTLRFMQSFSVLLLRLGLIRLWLVMCGIRRWIRKLNSKGPSVGFD